MAGRSAARGADDWVERVRAASDIVEVVRQTVSLRRSGRNWVGLCPFHQEKTPSFSVHAERQFYHCFSCKAGGDVFKFVQETEKVGFIEAAELLSRRAGIPVPDVRGGGVERGLKARLIEALDLAATAYEQWLGDASSGAATRAYLERRGLTRDTIRSFRIGFAPAGWENLVQRLRGKVPPEILVQAGLAAQRAEEGRPGRGGLYDRFRNRLMVPLVAPGAAVIGFGARALAEEDQPKYLNSPETPVYRKGAFLFALEQARHKVSPEGEMIVVEGYFDAMALHQAGLSNCVATSGTALTPEQAKLLRRHVGRVALTYDGDAAGRDAMMRSLGVLLSEGLDVVVVDLPQGEDPDTLIRKGGKEAWEAARGRAADPVEFVQRHVLRVTEAMGVRGGDPRERALQAVVALGGSVQDPVRVKLLFERAAQLLGFPEAVLERGLALKKTGQGAERPLAAAARDRRNLEHGIERLLLRALIQAPAARDDVIAVVEPADFKDPACAAVARWLWSGAGGLPDEDEARTLVRELELTEGGERNWPAEVRGAARLLRLRRLRQERQEREQELRRSGTDPETERRLSREIQEIARSMKNLSEREAGT